MTPVSVLFIIISCLVVVAFLVSRVVEALFRISRRIESTNTHLDEIRTEITELAQILSTTLIDSHKKQNDIEGRVEDLENENSYEDDFDEDLLLEQAVSIVTEAGAASASLIQRRLSIGYARAARLLDQLEQKGYVGPAEGSKPRMVFASPTDAEPLFEDAVKLGLKEGKISPAMLQRKLQIGYARASRIIDLLEGEGYVGRADGAKPRPMLK
jgi:DNA segregation ATPase FtsK/SpoIIIE-like protein